MATPEEKQIREFASAGHFEQWLAENYTQQEGIWLKLAKKNTGVTTVTYPEAVDIALCYGWIDGQTKSVDSTYYIQKFTPRRPKSIWSKINTEKVERLIAEGRMKEPGLKEIEKAKADGRWEKAYSSYKNMTPPEDFLEALQANEVAAEFYKTLNRTNIYAINYQLETAKRAETRQKRMKEIIEMLSQGKKYGPPQK